MVVVVGKRHLYVPDSLLEAILLHALRAEGKPEVLDDYIRELLRLLQYGKQGDEDSREK